MDHLYGPEVDFVDWRRFLLCAALPWPLPSVQDLLDAWSMLVTDPESVGRKVVHKESFMATEIWLNRPNDSREDMHTGFNRNQGLKEVKLSPSTCCNAVHSTKLFSFIAFEPD